MRRPFLAPLVPLYAAILRLKSNFAATPKKLTWPVISVGSVSAGGAGKTPIVIALAKLLSERGHAVDVLSRGYKRESTGIQRVDPTHEDAATFYGDEPVLIERATNVPVYVGTDRFASGTLAEQNALTGERGIHLLDDGFQHRQLARTIDIALITAEDLIDTLIPAGNLREPLSTLQLADIVIIREEEREAVEKTVTRLMRSGALLWSIHRRLHFPQPLGVLSAGLRPLAFCAIARPADFAAALAQAGCGVLDTVIYDDHARYTGKQIAELLAIAKHLNATGFFTTEKDAVKLTPDLREQLEAFGPLIIVPLVAEFLYPERSARELESRLT